jgi:hypothetical protein
MISPLGQGEPSKRHLRHFAWIMALTVAVGTRYCGSGPQPYLALAAALFFSIGTVLPGAFRWPYKIALTGFYPVIWFATIVFLLVLNLNVRRWPSAFSRYARRLDTDRQRRTTSAVGP